MGLATRAFQAAHVHSPSPEVACRAQDLQAKEPWRSVQISPVELHPLPLKRVGWEEVSWVGQSHFLSILLIADQAPGLACISCLTSGGLAVFFFEIL